MTTALAKSNVHPWGLGLAELTNRIAHCEVANQQLIQWAYAHSRDNNLALADFCGLADVNPSTLSKILNGTYVNPRNPSELYDLPGALVEKVSALKSGIASKLPSSVQFVRTDTCSKIWFNCDLARESRSPVFLSGASHIGKTTALKKYCDAHPHDTYFVPVLSSMGTKGLAVAVANAVGVSAQGSIATITQRLRQTITRDKVLIFDDFHVLVLGSNQRTFLMAMEFIRALYDADNCGIVFSTTDIDFDRIIKDFKTSLHQLLRRGIHRPNLGKTPLQKDVRAIVEAHGLKWPAKSFQIDGDRPYDILSQLAQHSGLKGITERLRYSFKFAARNAEALTWSHFLHAQAVIDANSSEPANDW